MNYHGIIVDASQKDKSEFGKLEIAGQKKSGGWILYKVEVSQEKLERTISRLQKNINDGFYFHFYKGSELIVVFKRKIFRISTNKSTWKEAIEYGKSLGIPEKQLDFRPCRIEDETY